LGITFLGKDRPGLFSDIAGALALNNINILSAEIYTWRDGTAVDIFRVTGPLDTIQPEETWQRVRMITKYLLRKTIPSLSLIKSRPIYSEKSMMLIRIRVRVALIVCQNRWGGFLTQAIGKG